MRPDLGILSGGVRSGRRQRLMFIGISILAIGLEIALVTYRVETRGDNDPRVAAVLKSVARANRRQMELLYGTTGAEIMGWARIVDEPAGHAALIGLASAVAAIFSFRAAQLSGRER